MSENGGDTSVRDSILRFMGLAGNQQRGQRKAASGEKPRPSPEELRNLSIANMLHSDEAGARLLLALISERISDANLSAQTNVTSHPLCAGFLGAEAALKRLHDDLNTLRGYAARGPA